MAASSDTVAALQASLRKRNSDFRIGIMSSVPTRILVAVWRSLSDRDGLWRRDWRNATC